MGNVLNAVGLAAALTATIWSGSVPHAQAARLPSWGAAEVKSVDGPGLLTLERKGRSIPIRLFFVDLPQAGECGSEEATAALRGFVSRAPKRVRYSIAARYPTGQLRDPDGRYRATVTYSSRRQGDRGFGSDLLRAEWARPGERALVDEPWTSAADLYSGEYGDDEAVLLGEPRTRRGVWARCGGRLHAPVGQPPTPSAPATWSVDERGITSAVGPLTFSPTLSPASSLTLRQLSALVPVEMTRWSGGCRAWIPSMQIRTFAYVADDAPCGDGAVSAVSTVGPDEATLARGGAIGRPAAELSALFPLLIPEKESFSWRLSGPVAHPWAWQTLAEIGSNGVVERLVAYAAPELPGR